MKSLICFTLILASQLVSAIDTLTITDKYLHLRNNDPREWAHFSESTDGKELSLTFDAPNPKNWKLLTLRQAETKQTWQVVLNGKKIGKLTRDHNDQEKAIVIPPDIVKSTGNQIRIFTTSADPDDIMLGELELHSGTLTELTKGTHLTASVVDEAGAHLPCRFTIVDSETSTLVLTSEASNDNQAVRSGVIYSLDGKLSAHVGANREYKIYIGRGFEYELLTYTSESLVKAVKPIVLKRQVNTDGLVSCDTHLHTFQHARHGDCNVTERIISVAGEGIELPISTEHNKHIDYSPEAKRIGALSHMTPVVGCEVTTHEGHFNSFPIKPEVKPAEHILRPWADIFRNIYKTGAKVCIMNHPRDVHRDFTPLDPSRWDRASGTFTDGRKLEANGFELINSGATKTDPMELVHDWMALLRSGHKIAAFGSSDSHTVSFAIPGQSRTYIPVADKDPANIDVDDAVEQILAGQTMVSFGLLAQLKIEQSNLKATVSGPDWTQATSLTLFANGKEVETIDIPKKAGLQADVKATATWKLKDLNPKKGTFYVAVARGPGVTGPWWMMMPHYQSDSPVYEPYVFGVSAAIYPVGR